MSLSRLLGKIGAMSSFVFIVKIDCTASDTFDVQSFLAVIVITEGQKVGREMHFFQEPTAPSANRAACSPVRVMVVMIVAIS